MKIAPTYPLIAREIQNAKAEGGPLGVLNPTGEKIDESELSAILTAASLDDNRMSLEEAQFIAFQIHEDTGMTPTARATYDAFAHDNAPTISFIREQVHHAGWDGFSNGAAENDINLGELKQMMHLARTDDLQITAEEARTIGHGVTHSWVPTAPDAQKVLDKLLAKHGLDAESLERIEPDAIRQPRVPPED
jgi:hypothetical protein